MIKNTDTAVFWNLEAGHVMGLTVNLPSKLNGSGHAEKWEEFITPGTVKLLNYIEVYNIFWWMSFQQVGINLNLHINTYKVFQFLY